MTELAKAALVRVAFTALRLSDGFDAGRAARTVIVKLSVPMWGAAGAAELWHMNHGPDWAGGIVMILTGLAMTGTIIASIRYHFRRYSGDPARALLEALLATPPQQKADLRVVSEIESATRSSTSAPRRTAR